MKKKALFGLLAILLVLFNFSAAGRLRSSAPEGETGPNLFLSVDPEQWKLASLGHHDLLSDLLTARALTHFGAALGAGLDPQKEYLAELFFTACELAPHNLELVFLAANVMTRFDPAAANRLLNRSMLHNPQSWKIPEMIGFNHSFYLDQPARAARYYEIAARMPDRPPYVPSLAGKFYTETGRHHQALRVLQRFQQESRDPKLKHSFQQTIDDIRRRLEAEDSDSTLD